MQAEQSNSEVLDIAAHEITRKEGGFFSCEQGDTILSGALRAGVGIAYECNAGECGSCKVTLVSGEVRDLKPEAGGIRPRERERGKVLACQCVPQGPCTVSFRADPDAVPRIRPTVRQAWFVRSEPITHDIWEFTFQTSGAAEFLPGQYALLKLPGMSERRSYSMSNLPNADGIWQFQIRRVPGGAATGILFERMTEGDVCTLDGPYSSAYLRDAPRDIVCIAGGSGLAPMLSIVRGALAHPSFEQAEIHLFYGGRQPRDVFTLDRFADLAPHGQRINFIPAVSCEDDALDGWAGERGYIHDCVQRVMTDRFQDCEFYMAGPPPMVEATRRLLILEHGVATERIHYDRFF